MKSIVTDSQQHVTEPGNYFALFQSMSLNPLNIIIPAQLSLFSEKAITKSLLDKKLSWTLINFEVIIDRKSVV